MMWWCSSAGWCLLGSGGVSVGYLVALVHSPESPKLSACFVFSSSACWWLCGGFGALAWLVAGWWLVGGFGGGGLGG